MAIGNELALYWMAGAIPALLLAPASGSFAGLLAMRLPAGQPVGMSRSMCPHCGTVLDAIDLTPIVTWVATRGRCRHCGAKVPAIYPLIELAALVVAAWAVWVLPPRLGLLWATCVMGWVLLALALADWEEKVLPDGLTIPLGLGGFLYALFDGRWLDSVLGAGAGALAFLALRWAYLKWRGREGLGLGDVKLAAAAGAWVGWAALPSVVLLAAVAAVAAALPARLAGRLKAGAEVPFGPFLAAGLWLVWLYGPVL
jgi:leader peptidase (prepilin peptidase)/N-methyltransferase